MDRNPETRPLRYGGCARTKVSGENKNFRSTNTFLHSLATIIKMGVYRPWLEHWRLGQDCVRNGQAPLSIHLATAAQLLVVGINADRLSAGVAELHQCGHRLGTASR